MQVFHINLLSEEGNAVCANIFSVPITLQNLRAIDFVSKTLLFTQGLDLYFVDWVTRQIYSVISRDEGEELVSTSQRCLIVIL